MGRMWKSRHAGLNVKVRSALETRHPVTGDVIATRPAVRAEFGFATGEQRVQNPYTGEFESLEGYQGGFFNLDAVAEQSGWDEEIKAMVARRLDELCVQMPQSIQSVDFVTAPAETPWPTYDAETDPKKLVALAVSLGLAGKALAYERENAERADVIQALEKQLAETPEPEPAPPPVLATESKQEEPELLRVAVV
jgi:hypothetical protein